jgi:hypothetical protein
MHNSRPRQQLAGIIANCYLAQAIYVVVRLGVADRLRDGPQPSHQLADATGAHARSLHRLLRVLAGCGIFAEDEAGRFQLTELADLLRSDAPESMYAAVRNFGDLHYAAFGELLHSVRTGQPGFDKTFGMPLFDYFAANPSTARTFDAALADLRSQAAAALLDAYDFSGITRLVDVGGGAGSLLSAVLARYPKLSGVLFDRPDVAAAATGQLRGAGVQNRCEVIGGDFFDAVPAGGDVYLLRHVIHDWDDERAGRILVNCRRAMHPAARLLLVESVIEPGNAPSLGKFFDLMMLAMTGGQERTEPEYGSLLTASGLRLVRVTPTTAEIHVIEAEPIRGD